MPVTIVYALLLLYKSIHKTILTLYYHRLVSDPIIGPN